MNDMTTLQPNESINDHVKGSKSIIDHVVELSIAYMRDLANPREGTFVDMTFNEFMRSLTHIRESIEMLDELCDELEDDKDEARHEYEERVIQFFNRFMSNNPCNFCGNCKYFAFIAKEDGLHGCCHEYYLKEVDPDDASCDKFCHPCEKPDHEVCDNCDSDCDTCGYYPF